MHAQLTDFLASGRLFVDPAIHVDLSFFVPIFREWQQVSGFAVWTPARIEQELGLMVGERRSNGRAIKIVKGISKIDPAVVRAAAEAEAAANREAAEQAAQEARAARAAEESRARAEREAQEAEYQATLEAQRERQRQADAEAARNWSYKQELAKMKQAEFDRLERAGLLDYVEYEPGACIPIAEIAAKLPQAASLIDGDLLNYQWHPGCLTTDGRLKEWNTDDNGEPLPKVSPPGKYADFRDDPVNREFWRLHAAYYDRLIAEGETYR